MSKKDYIQFAKMISKLDLPHDIKYYIVNNICQVFKADNFKFNRDTFIEACNVLPPLPDIQAAPSLDYAATDALAILRQIHSSNILLANRLSPSQNEALAKSILNTINNLSYYLKRN